jgi:hypothetical protein
VKNEIERKLKIALDESRLLILGAQVLFGFLFQEAFTSLPRDTQQIQCAGLLSILAAIALLMRLNFRSQDPEGKARVKSFVQSSQTYDGPRAERSHWMRWAGDAAAMEAGPGDTRLWQDPAAVLAGRHIRRLELDSIS